MNKRQTTVFESLKSCFVHDFLVNADTGNQVLMLILQKWSNWIVELYYNQNYPTGHPVDLFPSFSMCHCY